MFSKNSYVRESGTVNVNSVLMLIKEPLIYLNKLQLPTGL